MYKFDSSALYSSTCSIKAEILNFNTKGQSLFISFTTRMAHPLLKLKRSVLLVLYNW